VIDQLTRHQLFLQRLAGGNWALIRPLLDGVVDRIHSMPINSEVQAGRYYAIRDDIAALYDRFAERAGRKLIPRLLEFAAYEAEFTQSVLAGAARVAITGVQIEGLTAEVLATPMQLAGGKTLTLPDMLRTFASDAADQVQTRILQGQLTGETGAQIARAVEQLADKRTRRQAEAIVRTATNHVGNQARAAVYRANADIIREEQIVATLDGRTTPVCRSRDGQRYPVGTGPVPPFHYGCRTVRVPVLDSRFAALGRGRTRASMDGPVSAELSYGDWLARQPQAFQAEVLGPGRASIFRAGKLPLSKFVDSSGRELTLDQLKSLEAVTL
jgi:SPP1 gp7 family putative phage head morphogenesis protein